MEFIHGSQRSKILDIHEDIYPNGFIGGVPRPENRYGLMQITAIANNNNVVAGDITYIFVTTLGSPGANQVHIKIQTTVRESCIILAETVFFGTANIGNVVYGAGVGANPIFGCIFTTQRIQVSTTGLTQGNNLAFIQLELDSAAQTLSSTTTRTLIAPIRASRYRYVFNNNSIETASDMQLIQKGVLEAGTVAYKILNGITINATSSGTTEKQMTIYISNNELTFIPIYSGLDISNAGNYELAGKYKIPSGYDVYCRCSSSGGVNSESIDFTIHMQVQNL